MPWSLLLCLLLPSLIDGPPMPLGPFGGSILAVSVHPTDAQLILIVSEADGLLRSTDGGVHWAPFGAGLPADVGLLERMPGTPDTLYAMAGSALFRSTNGGANWTLRSSGLASVQGLAPSPDPQVLLLVRVSDVLRSDDGGATTSVVFGPGFPRDAAFAASDGQRAYLTTDQGLHRSDDGGLGFALTAITGSGSRLAVNPTDADRLLVRLKPFTSPDTLWLSTDGGLTAVQASGVAPPGRITWAPGGGVAHAVSGTVGDWWHARSDDGGLGFTILDGPLAVGDPTDLAVAPGGAVFLASSPSFDEPGGLLVGPSLGPLEPRALPAGDVREVLAVRGSSVVAARLADGRLLEGQQDSTLVVYEPFQNGNALALATGAAGRWHVGGAVPAGPHLRIWTYQHEAPAGVQTGDHQGGVGRLVVSPHDANVVVALTPPWAPTRPGAPAPAPRPGRSSRRSGRSRRPPRRSIPTRRGGCWSSTGSADRCSARMTAPASARPVCPGRVSERPTPWPSTRFCPADSCARPPSEASGRARTTDSPGRRCSRSASAPSPRSGSTRWIRAWAS